MISEQDWIMKRDYYIKAINGLQVPFSTDLQELIKFNRNVDIVFGQALTDEAVFSSEYENIYNKKKAFYSEAFLAASLQGEEDANKTFIDENGKQKKASKPTMAVLEAQATIYINNEIVEEYDMPITKALEVSLTRSSFMAAVVKTLKDKRDSIGVLQSILKAEKTNG